MRDAQSAFDQVIAFAGQTITAEDVSTVLGLVGRDLLFDIIEAVMDEDAPKAFALADRATESGHDLRLVCRELAGVIRDLTIVSIDPARVAEAGMGEADAARLKALADRCSREDLLRAFDVLSRAEQDIRGAAQPRFHFEMAMLRWMHLRKLVPLTDLLAGGVPAPAARPAPPARAPEPARRPVAAAPAARPAPAAPAPRASAPAAPTPAPVRPAPAPSPAPEPAARPAAPSSGLKDALLTEIRAGKATLYNLAIAQAQAIEVTDAAITFTFAANHKMAKAQLEQSRDWLEALAERLTGRRIPVRAVQTEGEAPPPSPARAAEPARPATPGRDLRAEAMASSAVQAMLEVFPAELGDVEEI